MIGDFTGHGLAAAVGTLPVSRAFYSMAQKGMALGDIADEINNILLTLLPDDMFCAASIIELNNTGKSISIWAGGTPDMYLLNKEDNSILTIGSQHMALGILEPAEFETNYETFAVNENQCLIAFTDGVVELFNEDKEMFGYERLEKLLTKTNHNSIDDIVSALNQFKGAAESDDDISILSIKCKEVGSAQQNLEVEYSKLPHTFQLSLDANTVKTSDPVVEVVDMITYIRGAEEHRSTLFLLLSEAYNNALDHGLLGLNSELKDSEDGFLEYYIKREELLEKLDSGEIQIEMKYEPSTTTIYLTVTDSGSGFNTLTSPTIKNDNQEHGRGNVLLKELASSISYNEQGNQITIGYQLQTQ